MLFVEIKDLTSTDGSNTFTFFSCLDKAIQFANSSCGRNEFSAVDTDRWYPSDRPTLRPKRESASGC